MTGREQRWVLAFALACLTAGLLLAHQAKAAHWPPFRQARDTIDPNVAALEARNDRLERRNHRLLRKLARRERQLLRAHREARRRWAPTATAAIRLASRATGVSETAMRTVAFCESRFYPYAVNGRYKGLFQLGWAPFGLDPFDVYANALSAAYTVARDGSWRQWECSP